LNNPQRRQIILELLGPQFQRKFFPTDPDIPYILTPSYMPEEHRHKLENEAKSWLQIQTYNAAVEIGAGIEFIFLNFSTNLFFSSCNR